MTYGCKVNIAEEELSSEELSLIGYERVPSVELADIALINTCAVTEGAAKKSYRTVEKLRIDNPSLKIAVTGCLATDSDADLKAAGADIVITNGSKADILKHLISYTDGLLPIGGGVFSGGIKHSVDGKTRGFFKIQDGCDAFCSYCIIPRLRGTPRSMPIDDAVDAFRRSVSAGLKEIILVGIHIGLYGKGSGYGIIDLLRRLINIHGDYRIRLTSIEVTELTAELLELIASSGGKICPHLHIPLQSGSDRVLKSMGRHYTADDYIVAARLAKSIIPNLTIGADIIVGFPGETEAEFSETLETVNSAGVDFIHQFQYSDRRGTAASMMTDKVAASIKKARALKLAELASSRKEQLLKDSVGKSYKVLIERGGKGHSENYILVRPESPAPINTFQDVLIKSYGEGYLNG